MNREKYLQALEKQLERNIFYHSLSLEACMAGLYDYFQSQNLLSPNDPAKEDWMIAGLLHDIDFSGEFKQFHQAKTLEALAKYGLEISETVHNIIKAHAPDLTGRQPQNKPSGRYFALTV